MFFYFFGYLRIHLNCYIKEMVANVFFYFFLLISGKDDIGNNLLIFFSLYSHPPLFTLNIPKAMLVMESHYCSCKSW